MLCYTAICGQSFQDPFDQGGNFPTLKYEDKTYEGVYGSPFFNEEWVEGEVITIDGKIYKNVLLKYDSYQDELVYNDGIGSPVYVFKEKIREFTLKFPDSADVRFVKHRFNQDFRYYHVIYDGSYLVLEEMKTSFIKVNQEGGYMETKKYDEFRTYSNFYYMEKDSNAFFKLKPKPNQVSKIFSDKNDKIKDYISVNELDCKSTMDLNQIFSYYDGL